MRRVLLALLLLVVGVSSQGTAPQVIEGTVTTITGRSLVVDLGTKHGVRIGDRMRVLPEGGLSVEAIVRSVTEDTARLDLTLDAAAAAGDRVEFVVPARPRRIGPTRGAAPAEPPPHPPWTHPPIDWKEGVPLLAEVEARTPEERDVDIRASAFLQGEVLRDSAGSSSTTMFGRVGARWEGTNLFGNAGRLRFDGETYTRRVDLEEGSDVSTSGARIDELSYSWGGDRRRPVRWAVGRSLTESMPEFGLLDGVQWSRRRKEGDRFGVTAGLLPVPNDQASTGDDVQLAAWYGWGADRLGTWSARLGAQKTWHRGEADRDLVVGSFNAALPSDATLTGTAWLDWYTSGDTTKSDGFELTQLFTSLRQPLGDKSGITLTHTQIRFPELLRDEFPVSVLDDLSDKEVTRSGVRGWHDLSRALRLDARFEVWEDDVEDGIVAELRGTLRDVLVEGGSLSAAVFRNEARFRDANGLRLRWSQRTGQTTWRTEWNATSFDQAGTDAQLQHVVRATLDRPFGTGWSLAAHAEQRFGDDQDASAAGLTLRRRW